MSFAGGSRSESGLRPVHINPIPEWTTATFEVPSSKSCPPGSSTSTYYPTTPTYHEAVQRSKSTRRPLRSSPLAGPALISSSSETVPADSSPQRRTSFASGISLKPSSLIPRPLSALLRSKSSQSLPRSTSKAPFDDACASSSSSSSTPSARPTGRYSVRPGISPLQSPSPRVVGPRPPSGSIGTTTLVNDPTMVNDPTEMHRRRLPRAQSAMAVRPIPAMPSPSVLTLTEVQMQTEEPHPRSRTVQISDQNQTLIHSRSHPRLPYPHAHNYNSHPPGHGHGGAQQGQLQLRQGDRTTMDARLRTSDVAPEKSASAAYPSPPASPRLLRADSSSSFSSSSSYGSTRPSSLARPSPTHARSPPSPSTPTTPGTGTHPHPRAQTSTRPRASSSTNANAAPASPRDNTWYTHHAYAITPRFSRLGLSAPGVVLPIPAKEFRRRSAAAALGGQSSRSGGGGGIMRGMGMGVGVGGGGMGGGKGTIGSIPEGRTPEGKLAGGDGDVTLDFPNAVTSVQKTPAEDGDAVCPPLPSSVSSTSMRSPPTPHVHVTRDSTSNSLPTPPHTPLSLTNANDNAVSAATDIAPDTGEHGAAAASDAADATTNVHVNSLPTPPTSPDWLKFPPQIHQTHIISTSPYDLPTPTNNHNHTQYTHPMRTRSNTASSTSTTSTLFLGRSHASEFQGNSPSPSNFGSTPALSVASTVTSLDLSSAVSIEGVGKPPTRPSHADTAETHSLRSLRPTTTTTRDTETDAHLKVLEVRPGPALSKRKSMLARVKSWRWTSSPPSLASTESTFTPVPTSTPTPPTPSTATTTSNPSTPQIPSTTSAPPPTQSDAEPGREAAASLSNSASDSETPAAGHGVGSGSGRCPVALESQASALTSASEPSSPSVHQSSERAEPEVAGGCREERDCNVNASTSIVSGLAKETANANTDDLVRNGADASPTSVPPPTPDRVLSAQPSPSPTLPLSQTKTKTKDAQALVEVRYLDVEISEPGPKRVRYKQSGSLRRAWRSLRGGV